MTKEIEKETEKTFHIPPNWRANYLHWNLMRTITITQGTYLTIGVEPDTSIHSNSIIKARFKEISELAGSWANSDALRYDDMYCTVFSPAVWLKWLELMEIKAPPAWQPIKSKVKQRKKKIPKPERQRAEAMRAAKLMLHKGRPAHSTQDVVIFMRNDSLNYQNCCLKIIQDSSLIKAINQRAGGDLLESQEYKTALAQFQSDKPDKPDNSRHLPLVNLSKPK
ncbi:MAG: hypothetical protein IIA10_03515 [Proteobacteria bacterium]|nr:hypothetical protein [Pseudomonadota bacterium]